MFKNAKSKVSAIRIYFLGSVTHSLVGYVSEYQAARYGLRDQRLRIQGRLKEAPFLCVTEFVQSVLC